MKEDKVNLIEEKTYVNHIACETAFLTGLLRLTLPGRALFG